MLMSLKDNLSGAIGIAAAVVFALLLGLLAVSKISIESLKAKNASLNADITQMQVNEQALTRSNDNKDQRINQLERDYRIIIDLNTANRNRLASLKVVHERLLTDAHQLKDSPDEPTKDWANAVLPADALQLLSQASCQSRDTNKHDLCFAPP